MIRYMNYSSDYDKQFLIGSEHLEDASIPVEYNGFTGLSIVLEDYMLKEMKEDMTGYYNTFFKKGTKMYVPESLLTKEPAYRVPMEFAKVINLNTMSNAFTELEDIER